MGPKDIEGSVVAGGDASTAFTTPGGGSNSNPRTSTSITMDMLGTRISGCSTATDNNQSTETIESPAVPVARSDAPLVDSNGNNNMKSSSNNNNSGITTTMEDERTTAILHRVTMAQKARDLREQQRQEKQQKYQKPIAMIGAGVAGVAMAGALMDYGIEDFVVFDKHSKPGGLWVSNYPNAKGMYVFCTFRLVFGGCEQWLGCTAVVPLSLLCSRFFLSIYMQDMGRPSPETLQTLLPHPSHLLLV